MSRRSFDVSRYFRPALLLGVLVVTSGACSQEAEEIADTGASSSPADGLGDADGGLADGGRGAEDTPRLDVLPKDAVSSDATSTGDSLVPVLDSAVADAVAVADAGTCDPEAWSWVQAAEFPGMIDPNRDTAPFGDNCLPTIDRHCETACDCRFVISGDMVDAANVASPWYQWPCNFLEDLNGGTCFPHECDGTVPGVMEGVHMLDCIDGLCAALGPRTVNPP